MAAGGIHTSLEHEPCGRHGTYRAINNQEGRERRGDVRGRAQVREIRRQLGPRKSREMGTKQVIFYLCTSNLERVREEAGGSAKCFEEVQASIRNNFQ